MPKLIKKLATPAFLTGSSATYYQVASGRLGVLRMIHLANNTDTQKAVAVSLFNASTGNVPILVNKIVPGSDHFTLWLDTTLIAGEAVTALCSSASAVTITLGGYEIID